MIHTAYYKNYEKKINKLHFQYYFGKQNVKTNTDLLQFQIKKTFLINFTIFYKSIIMLLHIIAIAQFYNYTKKTINVPAQFISMINLVPSTGKKREKKKENK